MRLCTVCGVVTSRLGSRCTTHARQSNCNRHNALYSTRAWQRFSARVLRAWRGQYGNWCPGFRRDAHPASDLTVDHMVPLAAGGSPLDLTNGDHRLLCGDATNAADVARLLEGAEPTLLSTDPPTLRGQPRPDVARWRVQGHGSHISAAR